MRGVLLAALLIMLSANCVLADEAVDFAHIDSGATVHAVSEGVNPPPYDVRAAIGEGDHLSYPGALPNWFELDLGQMREIVAIEIDRRYADRGPDDFDLSFGAEPDDWSYTLEVRGVGHQDGRHWFCVLDAPVEARYVRLEVLSLHEARWTVLNRLSLYGTSRLPRLVEHNVERYGWLSGRLERLKRETAKMASLVPQALQAAADEAGEFQAMLDGGGEISEHHWRRMEDRFRNLQDRAYDAEARLSFDRLRRQIDAPAAVGAVGAMTQVFRHVWPEEAADTLDLQLARNERESGQIVLAAVERDLEVVEISVDPLTGPVTLEDAVEPGLICYVRTRGAPLLTNHVGLWPDGISALAEFDLLRGEVQPIWITVAIPEDAPAGEYSTTVHLRANELPEISVPVRVSVWDFALPRRISLPNIFSISSQLVDSWYRNEEFGWEELRYDYYDFWLEHRLNPTSLYGTMQPPIDHLEYPLERGMNTFVMRYVNPGGHRAEEEYFQGALEDLGEWDEVLARRGLYDDAIVYLADEPPERQSVTDEINRRARIIAEHFPQMRRMLVLTRPLDRAFEGNVDIWCPIVGAICIDDAREAQERGEEYWWYTVGHFFDLDMPSASARTMPWLTFKHDLDGILYWLIQSGWRRRNRPTTFKPEPGETVWETFDPTGHANRNGIGNMCYPGPDGRPLSTQRLQILRDGMEDYEYLVMLRNFLEDQPDSPHAHLLEVPEEFATEYPVGTCAGFITERRRAIGNALEELVRAAGEE